MTNGLIAAANSLSNLSCVYYVLMAAVWGTAAVWHKARELTQTYKIVPVLSLAILAVLVIIDIGLRAWPNQSQSSLLAEMGARNSGDPRDIDVDDERKFINALAQSKSPGQHFHIFCVNDESCRVANKYRDRLARAGWKNLPAVDPIARDGISILTYTETNNQPTQVGDLTRAFETTNVRPSWSNGSGATGATIGTTGPSDEATRTTTARWDTPILLKEPDDFALLVGPLK